MTIRLPAARPAVCAPPTAADEPLPFSTALHGACAIAVLAVAACHAG